LRPLFYELLEMAHNLGFTTSIVTNGSLINNRNIRKIAKYTDWIGISVDSISNATEADLGRGTGKHVSYAIKVSDLVHEYGIKLKVNTTVTRLTYQENMHKLIHRMNPHRWKAFQVLHIKGQNDDCIEKLGITKEQFKDFIGRHEQIQLRGGVKPIFEFNDDMINSYFMLSPSGKIISNSDDSYQTFEFDDFLSNSKSVMDVSKYLGRGAVYDWYK